MGIDVASWYQTVHKKVTPLKHKHTVPRHIITSIIKVMSACCQHTNYPKDNMITVYLMDQPIQEVSFHDQQEFLQDYEAGQ